MTQYILNIRDDVPLEEVRSAVVNFGRGISGSNTVNSEGNIIMWSSRGWNCGYATPVQEETHD